VKNFSVSIAVLALILNIFGGMSALGGVYLIALKSGVDFFGWGDARSVGYLLFCVGLCLVCAGIVLAKYSRK